MAQAWMVTKREFVGPYPMSFDDMAEMERRFAVEVIDMAEGRWSPVGMRHIDEDVSIAKLADSPGDVALIYGFGTPDQEVVGGYCQEVLWVHHAMRGRGYAPELVLAAYEDRDGNLDPFSYTPGGLAAHCSAHRLSVQRALKNGLEVPWDVLRDYPSLLDAWDLPLPMGEVVFDHDGDRRFPEFFLRRDERSGVSSPWRSGALDRRGIETGARSFPNADEAIAWIVDRLGATNWFAVPQTNPLHEASPRPGLAA